MSVRRQKAGAIGNGYFAQGGKDGRIRLLSLKKLTGRAYRR